MMTDTTYLEIDENNQATHGPFIIDPDLFNPQDNAIPIDGINPVPQIGWFYNSVNNSWTEGSILVSIKELRLIRDSLLQECDWISWRHNDGNDPAAPFDWNEWSSYRQALREITEGYTDVPEDQINWPIKPINS